jgi:hypothetical protein
MLVRFDTGTSLPHPTASGLNWEAPLMLPDIILRLRCGVVNGPRLVIGTSRAGCLLPHLRSFQLPFQPLQCGSSFVRPNDGLAVLAIAHAHQNGDVLQALLDKREITAELNNLLVC